MRQLRLIRRTHDHHAGQTGQIGHIKNPRMCGPVGTDKTSPVDSESHRKFLDRDVMNQLIITALQEGRVERTKWFHTLTSETGGESHRMLFGNANIKNSRRKTFLNLVQTSSRRHRSGDGNNAVILLCSVDQRLGKDRGVAGNICCGLLLCAGDHVKFRHGMVFFGRWAGKGMPPALFSDDMYQHRPGYIAITQIFQNR